MQNVLFVLYHDFTSNSAYHVHSLANGLVELGHRCAAVVPEGKKTVRSIGSPAKYQHYQFSDFEGHARPCEPDIVHCWTPREVVRSFVESHPALLKKARLVVHLEDNEFHITQRSLRLTPRQISQMTVSDLDHRIVPALSHPIRAREFLSSAAGITILMRKLDELVPRGVPHLEIWPSADETLFGVRPIDWAARHKLGIARNSTTIAYSGNVHASNAHEVRSLYLAVAMLNREGHPATLIRTGRDFVPFLGEENNWARKHSVELGFVDREELPRIMALADVFVQPGLPGPFNDYRFPSKLPEFCAIGRPVILPATNVGLEMRHREDAFVVPEASAVAIADAVREIRGNPKLAETLAGGARRFFENRLRWPASVRLLHQFYGQLTSDAAQFSRNGITEPLAVDGAPSPAPMVRNSKF